ncbi:hypothetical protein ACF0H5_007962 [Mactra antiquata]
MKFDDVLEHIGTYGIYQKYIFVLSCIPEVFVGLFLLNTVFLLAIPNHRCEIPGYDNDTYKIQNTEHEDLINKYIPTSDDYDYNRCYVCHYNNTSNHIIYEREIRPQQNCSLTEATQCNKWVYDKTDILTTFVTQIDLVCDKEIWVANIQMIFYGGMLVGSVASGVLSDKYGRKVVTYISMLVMVASSIGLSWANTLWLFCVLEFILGCAVVASFMPIYVITLEITGTDKRVWPGIVSNFPYTLGLLILSGVAYGFKDWFKIQLYTSIPGVILVSFWWIIPESPRWLLTKGRVTEAIEIINKMAKWNGTTPPDRLLDLKHEENEEESSWIILFTTRKQLLQTCIIFFNWAAVALAYFGLALNSGNLHGDLYLNFALSGLVEIPAYVMVVGLVDRVGRRKLYSVTMIIGGLSCASTLLAIKFGTEDTNILVTILSLLGRLCVTAAFAVAYIHSAELFPTVVRNAGLGGASLFARVGTMVAPYIVVWGDLYGGMMKESLPLLVFGIVSLMSGVLSLLLPETLNMDLPDSLQEKDVRM